MCFHDVKGRIKKITFSCHNDIFNDFSISLSQLRENIIIIIFVQKLLTLLLLLYSQHIIYHLSIKFI